MRELADIFGSSADAVFATDRARRIVYANAAFLRLCPQSFPFDNRRCDQVLCGQTLDGKPACRPDCRIAIAALAHRPVASFDLSVPRTHAGPLWVNIGAYSLAARLRPAAAVFVLRPISRRRMFTRFECFERPRHGRETPRDELTARERMVLALLSEGLRTEQLAEHMQISRATVRNHIRSILQKLDVHSRAEAVSLAFRRSLV